jgi:hypothetical protein
MRADGQKALQFADLIDLDLPARRAGALCRRLALARGRVRKGFGLDHPEVRVIAQREPAAGLAGSASHAVATRYLAEQRLRERPREKSLAEPRWPVNEQGVRQG